jgi:hypothetical protein
VQIAVVVAVSERRQMAALDCGGGRFCALEWQTGPCLRVGQVLEGEFSQVGPTDVTRAGSTRSFPAYLHIVEQSHGDVASYCR